MNCRIVEFPVSENVKDQMKYQVQSFLGTGDFTLTCGGLARFPEVRHIEDWILWSSL